MTIDTPTWLQNGTYSARLDRIFSDILFTEGVMRPGVGQFQVTPASPAAMSVQVAAGYACVTGDDQPDQGNYLVRSTATETLTVTAAPGSNSRIDLVILRINDPDAGGPAGNNATLAIIAGTPAASPSPPALPTSAIPLARITVAAGTTAITAGMITDVRGQAQTIFANTLTNAGDLLSFDGANTVRIPLGTNGYPLVSTGSTVGYSQLGSVGLATNAVTSTKIADLNVTTAKLADLSVTTGKLADGAVTASKIAGGGFSASNIRRTGCELTFSRTVSSSIFSDVTLFTEVFDSDGFYSSGSDILIPSGRAGLYLVTLSVSASPTNGVVVPMINIPVNATITPPYDDYWQRFTGIRSGYQMSLTWQGQLLSGAIIRVSLLRTSSNATATGRIIVTQLAQLS